MVNKEVYGCVRASDHGGVSGSGKTNGKWLSPAPTNCDTCNRPIHSHFVDGRIHRGPWANMCMSCHALMGVGFGTGKGQHYERQGDEWIKVEG